MDHVLVTITALLQHNCNVTVDISVSMAMAFWDDARNEMQPGRSIQGVQVNDGYILSAACSK